jgi:hypothetical protein
MDFGSLLHSGANRCALVGIGPDGSVLAVVTRDDTDSYRLQLAFS